MQQPLLAPPVAGSVMAPGAPRAPPPGLWMAPCGCFFDPRVFHFEWVTPAAAPPANPMGSASLPNVAPQSWVNAPAPPQQFVPYKQQGTAVAPVLQTVPNFQQLEGEIQQVKILDAPPSGTAAVPTGGIVPFDNGIAPPNNGIVPFDNGIVPPDNSIVPFANGIVPPDNGIAPPDNGIPVGTAPSPSPEEMGNDLESLDIDLPDEVLLEEALKLFSCSPEMEAAINQGSPSSAPEFQDLGALADLEDIICHDLSSLSLPDEVLSPDYSIPEVSDVMLSMEQPDSAQLSSQEMHQDPTPPALLLLTPPRGDELQPKAKLEKRGKKRRNSFLLRKGCK